MTKDNKQAGKILLVVLVLVLVLLWLWLSRDRRGGPVVQQLPVTATQPVKQIKVGVILSWRTAESIGSEKVPRGYDKQLRIARDLLSPDIHLIPILESDAGTAEKIPSGLAGYFPMESPVFAKSAADLAAIDVFINGEVWTVGETLVRAVEEAVRNGKGMVNYAGFAGSLFGRTGQEMVAEHLAALENPRFGLTNDTVNCTILKADPILGELANSKTIQLRPMGVYGKLAAGATPIVRVNDLSVVTKDPVDDGVEYYPLYQATLGKGRVLGVQFAAYKLVPDEWKGAGRGKFFQRCVRWAADVK